MTDGAESISRNRKAGIQERMTEFDSFCPNPRNAGTVTNNHAHHLIQRPVEAIDYN